MHAILHPEKANAAVTNPGRGGRAATLWVMPFRSKEATREWNARPTGIFQESTRPLRAPPASEDGGLRPGRGGPGHTAGGAGRTFG